MRAAIYARYSSDLQSAASIEDQARLCRRLIDQNGWTSTETYADAGISGASQLRPGYQQLLADARAGRFDVVVAEGLDRVSRDQEHIASFFKHMRFQDITVVTVAEGEVSELHIGLKGTMSSLFLKELAQKTHRGLEGRVRQGKSAGGLTYGYRVVRSLDADGAPTTGERVIDERQVEIVRRIFEEYAAGRSPRAIVGDLNKDGIPGPRGTWGASTVYGNAQRGTGILNNELYVGRLVWNRQRFIKDPVTGRRQARPNPPEAWVVEEVPELRIVEDALWDAVKARQQATRSQAISDGLRRPERARRPAHIFSGLITCGACGGGVILVGKAHYGCANHRNKGTCDNRLTLRRDALETRVLHGLRDQLLHPDLIAEFVRTYQEEFNRAAGERRGARTKAAKELGSVTRQVDRIVEAIAEGLYHPSMKEKMTALEDRKAALEAELADAEAEPPAMLHPGLADVYRTKIADLSAALSAPTTRQEASQILRSLLSEIRLIPEDGALVIELVGELAGLLALGEADSKTPRGGATGRSTTLVAGARIWP